MTLRFNRSQLFWYGVIIILAAFALHRCFLLLTWNHTNGKVVAYDVKLASGETVRFFPTEYNGKTAARWSVVAFQWSDSLVHFEAGENLGIPLGTSVPVLHSRRVPTKAFINSFFGLWFRPLLVLPVIVWALVAVGLMGKNSFWVLRLFPFSISRTDIQKKQHN